MNGWKPDMLSAVGHLLGNSALIKMFLLNNCEHGDEENARRAFTFGSVNIPIAMQFADFFYSPRCVATHRPWSDFIWNLILSLQALVKK